MSSYFSMAYLAVFLPVVMTVYNLLPQKHRWKILLGASYGFFFLVSGKLIAYLLVTTGSVYGFGLWMASVLDDKKRALEGLEREEKKAVKTAYQRKLRKIAVLAVLMQIGILVVVKYTEFFGTNLNTLLAWMGLSIQVPIPNFLKPVGISFYTLQAASYLLDVYRGTIRADRNLGRVALYLSFFPQIMEGPICRYAETADQLWAGRKVTYRNMTFGMQRILYGFMKKKIIADRLNVLIETVFANYAQYDGGVIFVAMLCYTFQLYMDFSGALDVVIGSAQICGVTLPENFQQPFFSRTISEFWKRWHITLGAWFRDYVFYPLSISKPMKHLTSTARKRMGNRYGALAAGSIALFAVWTCNGLWHGAGWTFLFFGLYHFVLILCGNIAEPLTQDLCEKYGVNRQHWAYRAMQILRTVLLVNVGELIFRAVSLPAAVSMIRIMVTDFTFASIADGTLFTLGMDRADFLISIAFALALIPVGLAHERGICIRERIAAKPTPVRWAVYYAMILAVIIFGAYGVGYVPLDPIYANF